MGYFEDWPNFQFKLYRYLNISTNKVTTPKENQVHRPPWEEGLVPSSSPFPPLPHFLLPPSLLVSFKAQTASLEALSAPLEALPNAHDVLSVFNSFVVSSSTVNHLFTASSIHSQPHFLPLL
jgi:hypothetical protein